MDTLENCFDDEHEARHWWGNHVVSKVKVRRFEQFLFLPPNSQPGGCPFLSL